MKEFIIFPLLVTAIGWYVRWSFSKRKANIETINKMLTASKEILDSLVQIRIMLKSTKESLDKACNEFKKTKHDSRITEITIVPYVMSSFDYREHDSFNILCHNIVATHQLAFEKLASLSRKLLDLDKLVNEINRLQYKKLDHLDICILYDIGIAESTMKTAQEQVEECIAQFIILMVYTRQLTESPEFPNAFVKSIVSAMIWLFPHSYGLASHHNLLKKTRHLDSLLETYSEAYANGEEVNMGIPIISPFNS